MTSDMGIGYVWWLFIFGLFLIGLALLVKPSLVELTRFVDCEDAAGHTIVGSECSYTDFEDGIGKWVYFVSLFIGVVLTFSIGMAQVFIFLLYKLED